MRFRSVSTKVEVLSKDAFSYLELRQFAASVRGQSVKATTLRTWRNRIGIHADSNGFYSNDDLQLLGRYLEALAAGRTTTQFLNQEYGNNAQERSA